MADFCELGYLNAFVTPAPTGWGLDTTIKSWLATDKRNTHIEILDKIQAGTFDPAVKGLSTTDIKTIMDWMVGQGMIGKPETQTITYVPAV
jgi:hypothetical protein